MFVEAFWFFFSSPFVSRWITPGSLCWIFTAGRADAECPRSPLAPLARRPPHPPPSPPHPPPNPSFQTGHTSLANLDSCEGHSSKCWTKNTVRRHFVPRHFVPGHILSRDNMSRLKSVLKALVGVHRRDILSRYQLLGATFCPGTNF